MPSYLTLYRSGELEDRAARALEMLRACTLCPHRCRANEIPRISRPLKPEEFSEVVNIARECGLERLDAGRPLGSVVSAYVEQSCF